MLYRVLRNLGTVGQRRVSIGEILLGSALTPEGIRRLEQVGAISELHAPPLTELPNLAPWIDRLAVVGLVTADQLLECDIDETSHDLGISVTELTTLKQLTTNWLIVIPKREG